MISNLLLLFIKFIINMYLFSVFTSTKGREENNLHENAANKQLLGYQNTSSFQTDDVAPYILVIWFWAELNEILRTYIMNNK